MRFIRQPNDRACGQTCVAMIAGCSVDDVCDVIGGAKTWPKDLRKALVRFGFHMEMRSKVRLPDYPKGKALFFGQTVTGHRLLGHWMVWTGKRFLDPSCGAFHILPETWSGRFYLINEEE